MMPKSANLTFSGDSVPKGENIESEFKKNRVIADGSNPFAVRIKRPFHWQEMPFAPLLEISTQRFTKKPT